MNLECSFVCGFLVVSINVWVRYVQLGYKQLLKRFRKFFGEVFGFLGVLGDNGKIVLLCMIMLENIF